MICEREPYWVEGTPEIKRHLRKHGTTSANLFHWLVIKAGKNRSKSPSTARNQCGSFECRIHLKCRFRWQLRSVLLLFAFPQATEAVESIRRQRSEYPGPGCAVPLLVSPL